MKEFGLKRDHLRMAVCLESFHAGMHKESLYYKKNHPKGRRYTPLQDVRQAPNITPNISILECARRADGAACLILASNRFLVRRNLYQQGLPAIIGGGESSGPLYPPRDIDKASYSSCEEAMTGAYASAGNMSARDIDFFGLYDCFPICLVRALEACGLTEKGKGGEYLDNNTSNSCKQGDHGAFLDRYRSLAMREVCIIVRVQHQEGDHSIVADGLAFLFHALWGVVIYMRDRALGGNGGLHIAK
jgi:acetyl-CoA acetyltransferase